MGKFALLIGVGDYESSELQNLAAAIPDVRAIEKVLIDPAVADFAEADVTVLSDPEPQRMREAVERLFANRQKDDLVFLYFSGHGVVDDYGKFYLTCAQTDKGILNSTAIPATFIHELMEGCRSQRQVVILDSCFSGAFAKEMKAKGEAVNLQPQLGGKGRAVLTSSSATEYSFEQKEGQLSVYTQYVVEGLRTGIADRDEDGWISIDDLHEFATAKVREVAPAMQPKIYAVEEGYKIRFAKAPIGDPKLAYRKEVEKLAKARNGLISPILERGLTQRFRGQLSVDQMSKILNEVLQPYREFAENLHQFSLAVEEFLALPNHQQFPEDLAYFQSSLGLRDEDVKHLMKDTSVISPPLPVKLREIPKQKPKQSPQSNLSAEDYFRQGNNKFSLSDHKGAIEDYTKVIKLKPDYVNAYNNRGISRSNLNDHKGAIEDYTKAIKLKPDDADVYNNRGISRKNLSDHKGAIEDYTKAIELSSDNADAYYNRAVSRKALSENDKAIADYQKAADIYQKQGENQDYQDALKQITKLK
jgi:tetratricopeptide (TPR) repeat protein